MVREREREREGERQKERGGETPRYQRNLMLVIFFSLSFYFIHPAHGFPSYKIFFLIFYIAFFVKFTHVKDIQPSYITISNLRYKVVYLG